MAEFSDCRWLDTDSVRPRPSQRAAVAGARLVEASQQLEQARQLDGAGELAARIGALAAHVAIDQRRLEDAERLAQAALAAAERAGEMDVG